MDMNVVLVALLRVVVIRFSVYFMVKLKTATDDLLGFDRCVYYDVVVVGLFEFVKNLLQWK